MRSLFTRHRSFLAGATSLLAATVGLNLIVFTFVNALWLRPLPFRNADRLVTVLGAVYSGFADPFFATFDAVGGQVATDSGLDDLRPRLRFDQAGRDLETVGVTANYFQLLGLTVNGHDFVPNDDRDGADPVAIVSFRLWSLEFQRRSDLIGSVIAAQPVKVRVIGIAPSGFDGVRRGEKTDVWIPRSLVPRMMSVAPERTDLPMIVYARLRPGDTTSSADRRLKQLRSPTLTVVSLEDVYGTPETPTMLVREGNAVSVVAGLALLVLLGGCAALAALVLVHYERRRLEMSVKSALGASRSRLVGSLSRELAGIAVLGSCGAVLIASLGLQSIPSLNLPGGVDLGRLDVSLDWRVLMIALAVTGFTVAIAAWLPIARSTRHRLVGDLLVGPATTASVASQRLRQTLLAVLVSATVVVLIAAGLFVRAVVRGFGKTPGFDVNHTVFITVKVTPPMISPGATTTEAIGIRTRMVREAIGSIPAVDKVADGMAPIDPSASNRLRTPVVVRLGSQEHRLRLGRLAGSPELLSTLGIPILAGRGLNSEDCTMSPAPTVITESLARKLWPAQSPIGQVFSTSWRGGPMVVVGVARDFVFGSLTAPAEGVAVIATKDLTFGLQPRFVIRTKRPDGISLNDIRQVIKETLPDASSVHVATAAEVIARDLGRQRLGAWFFCGFGLVALIVGTGSVFGLVAYLAESRQREFGVRLALGATPRDLLRQGVMIALVPVSIGLGSGLIVAALVAHVFRSLLVGLSPLDGLTYASVAGMMILATVSAAVAAAWRLMRVMPCDALRIN